MVVIQAQMILILRMRAVHQILLKRGTLIMIIRFSIKAVKNNDWQISKYMKKYAKEIFLMYTPDKDFSALKFIIQRKVG